MATPDIFPATARIPCRPLSYQNKEKAVPKELLIDYVKGDVYVCKDNGEIIGLSDTLKEIILEKFKEDSDIVNNLIINIDGVDYELATIIAQQVKNIQDILNALGYYIDPETGEVKFTLIEKIIKIDPDTGDIIININASDVEEDDDHRFVTKDQLEQFILSTHPEVIKVTILGGKQAWTGTDAPYTQRVDVEEVKETDVPIVDISLGDIYDTVQKQLDSYAYIYKILTYDGYIMVYATQPTEDDVTVQMKLDRGYNDIPPTAEPPDPSDPV